MCLEPVLQPSLFQKPKLKIHKILKHIFCSTFLSRNFERPLFYTVHWPLQYLLRQIPHHLILVLRSSRLLGKLWSGEEGAHDSAFLLCNVSILSPKMLSIQSNTILAWWGLAPSCCQAVLAELLLHLGEHLSILISWLVLLIVFERFCWFGISN